MADWATISSLATAGATLVLAGATFAAVRSAQRSTRITERALLAAIRPVLVTTRFDDPPQKVGFGDQHFVKVEPGRAVVEVTSDVIYLACGVRNAGTGLAVLDRWFVFPHLERSDDHHDPEEFRRLTRDLYIAAGDVGFWQGALRDPADPLFTRVGSAMDANESLTIDLLYGDHEGGQRTISRFLFMRVESGDLIANVARHWNLDRNDPR